MRCRDVIGATTEYLDGALRGDARAQWESHIRSCGACARWVLQMRRTIALTAGLEEEDATSSSADRETPGSC